MSSSASERAVPETHFRDGRKVRRADLPDAARTVRLGAASRFEVNRVGTRLAMPPGVGAIPRFMLVDKDSTNHCTWQARDHERVFDEPGARPFFLSLLKRYKKKYGIEIYAYCLMGTHPHVICHCTKSQLHFSSFWRDVNSMFGKWCNEITNRSGQVVKDRMKSGRIERETQLLVVMRYGDLNPVRAGLVKSAKDWEYSSHRHYALGEPNELITDAPEYLALGRNGPERRKAYRALFALPLSKTLRTSRRELVVAPFIGDDLWVLARRLERGLTKPPS